MGQGQGTVPQLEIPLYRGLTTRLVTRTFTRQQWKIIGKSSNSLHFHNSEHNRHIYTLYSGHYCTKERSLLALRGKLFLFCGNYWGHAFSLTSLSRKRRKGRYYFLIDHDFCLRVTKHDTSSQLRTETASSFYFRQKYYPQISWNWLNLSVR